MQQRIVKNKQKIEELNYVVKECKTERGTLDLIKREIKLSEIDLEQHIESARYATSKVIIDLQRECHRKDNIIFKLENLHDYTQKQQDHELEEHLYLQHYKKMDELYRRNKLEAHNSKFQRSAKQCDEMYLNALELMRQLADKVKKKDKVIKE